jgi:C4-dicarboxylate-specific signal transduction histidine kinase
MPCRVNSRARSATGAAVAVGLLTALLTSASAASRWTAETLPRGQARLEQQAGHAIVQPEEAGAWARYRMPVFGAIVLMLLQAGIIGALLIERRYRRRLQRSLDDALQFERTLGQVSRALGEDGIDLDRVMTRSLERVAHAFAVKRALLGELAPDGTRLRLRFAWLDAGEPPPPQETLLDEFPRLAQALRDGQVLQLDARTNDPDAIAYVKARGVSATMLAPLRAAGATVGLLAVSSRESDPGWTAEHQQRLEAFAEIFANVLVHRRSQRQLRESEAFNRAVLASHAGEVAVTDAAGVIVAANEAWIRAARGRVGPLAGQDVGTAFGSAGVERAAAANARDVARAILRSVLDGARQDSEAVAEWPGSNGRAWSEIRVRKLDGPERGAVLSHVDITARKRAEIQVQQHLHELAHLNMMAAVGELAASVAHELNQPLTAVLSNAQALRRLLRSNETALDTREELEEIVEDIIEQDKRAAEVLARIRRLLKKETIDRALLDVNGVVADVTRMFGSDAAVPVELDLVPGLPPVRGDRVQLQQVVLNLVQNAMHADRSPGGNTSKRVVVHTRLERDGIRIVVTDTGPGIAADVMPRVFEPFFTTKREGLGLGLSISRSIVELHGGRIAARNLPEGGAEFSVVLPLEVLAV